MNVIQIFCVCWDRIRLTILSREVLLPSSLCMFTRVAQCPIHSFNNSHSSKHETFAQCWFNVGPASCVCWDNTMILPCKVKMQDLPTGKASRNCLLALQSSRMSRKYILYVYIVYTFPVNTQHLYNICAMSNRRRRRWAGYWVTTYYENRHCP